VSTSRLGARDRISAFSSFRLTGSPMEFLAPLGQFHQVRCPCEQAPVHARTAPQSTLVNQAVERQAKLIVIEIILEISNGFTLQVARRVAKDPFSEFPLLGESLIHFSDLTLDPTGAQVSCDRWERTHLCRPWRRTC
jgi:hypothetical protein